MLASSADAQLVQGRVRDGVSGRPLDGALVTLVVQQGGAETTVFSDSTGTYRFRAARAGAHRVQVRRIGYTPVTSAPFDVSMTSSVSIPEVALSPRPQIVTQIDIAANQQCRVNPRDGRGVVDLWEDVRTALEATVMTASEQRYALEYTSFARRLDARLREVARTEERRTVRGAVVVASIPADRLAREGYVVEEGRDVVYRALDAHVLLSDSFLESHCFRAAPRHPANDSLVGLAFEPVNRGTRVEVRGVLWLNRLSSELDAIDFSYEGLDIGVPTRDLGGRVEFEQLPSGRWIVDHWWIRMPRIERIEERAAPIVAATRALPTLAGFDEVGGTVGGVTRPQAAGTRGRRVSVAGIVHDSSTGRPLMAARIMVPNTTRVTMTNERGWFSLTNIPAGELSLSVTHPRLDSLTIGQWSWRIPDDTATDRTVLLALPPTERLLAQLCPNSPLAAGAGVLVGRIRDSTGAVAGAAVRARWAASSLTSTAAQRTEVEAGATTSSEGTFSLCGVPTDVSIEVESTTPGREASTATARIPREKRWARIDVELKRMP
jgi:hypothetical protein